MYVVDNERTNLKNKEQYIEAIGAEKVFLCYKLRIKIAEGWLNIDTITLLA